MTPETAARFARLTLAHVGREYPNKLDHVMAGPEDARTPSELHPIFYGSFDWHSCVHGWWQLLRLARLHPDLPESALIRDRADAMLTVEKMAGELAYLDRPASAGFERPYGWAWAMALHHEAAGTRWEGVLAPLAHAFADRWQAHLPKLTYPIRAGAHSNTAFALIHAFDWAVDFRPELAATIRERATHWYAADKGCQAWEPSGDDFLSPALCEAQLMSRVLGPEQFAPWFDGFLPDAAVARPATLFMPAYVSDRSDGKIAHLDGLNLSRAWCWRAITAALGASHPVVPLAKAAAERHLDASLPHIAGDYMGEHWLATFALLAIDQG
ncbi:DUF2891 domain-containing protein [Sphingomonas abietis]|uniref:DUF2891 domain-containing protein n=1 Tax=Sphingomonas abietis TaxID=3012344 RepID=A0ABY7NNZ0_9SPHN|nr:DUF2891 domain-containing protein [Sphingomonas abietis]WBO23243.1 DUF2891 domain-containing protein [Sphingomonas abietis]